MPSTLSLFDENKARQVLSVSQLTADVRRILETEYPQVWVEGELSNLSRPRSGHWYFTLKDARAQVRCAMFANRNRAVRFAPSDGMQIMVRGRVSLYEARGDFQIIAEHLAPAGDGALRATFEALKQRLDGEGLFAAERKRALPPLPQHIAIISSPTGAALRDIVSVLARRCPAIRVTLVPVAVQGKGSEAQLNAAFARLATWVREQPAALGTPPDVVLMARGGGSLEDLWSFNLESVARAAAACPVPLVVGVGHETDVTIADFVADVRAPTPSAGAELIAPDLEGLMQRIERCQRALQAHTLRALAHARQVLAHCSRRLVHPGRALQQQMQRVDELERQLLQAMQRKLESLRTAQHMARLRLTQQHPKGALAQARERVQRAHDALLRLTAAHIDGSRQRVHAVARALHAVSPLDTLSRGYAIVMQPPPAGADWGTPVTSVAGVRGNDRLVARLDDGRLDVTVDAVTVQPPFFDEESLDEESRDE